MLINREHLLMQSFKVSIHFYVMCLFCSDFEIFFFLSPQKQTLPSPSFLLCLPQLPLTPTYPYMFSLSLKQLVERLLQKQSYLKEELRNYIFLSQQAPTPFIQLISFPFPPFFSLSDKDTHMLVLCYTASIKQVCRHFPIFPNLENVRVNVWLHENILGFSRLILISQ